MNQLKTLKDFQKSNEWSVHVAEHIIFPQTGKVDGGYEQVFWDKLCHLMFVVWLIPIKALEKTDTPAGPVFNCRVALDDYRCYKFKGYALQLDNPRCTVGEYLDNMRAALHNVDLSRVQDDRMEVYNLDDPFNYDKPRKNSKNS